MSSKTKPFIKITIKCKKCGYTEIMALDKKTLKSMLQSLKGGSIIALSAKEQGGESVKNIQEVK